MSLTETLECLFPAQTKSGPSPLYPYMTRIKTPGTNRTFYLIFLILVSFFIVYIMVGLMLFLGEVFIERDPLAIPDLAIGIGIVLVFISLLISMIWMFIPAVHISCGNGSAGGKTEIIKGCSATGGTSLHKTSPN